MVRHFVLLTRLTTVVTNDHDSQTLCHVDQVVILTRLNRLPVRQCFVNDTADHDGQTLSPFDQTDHFNDHDGQTPCGPDHTGKCADAYNFTVCRSDR